MSVVQKRTSRRTALKLIGSATALSLCGGVSANSDPPATVIEYKKGDSNNPIKNEDIREMRQTAVEKSEVASSKEKKEQNDNNEKEKVSTQVDRIDDMKMLGNIKTYSSQAITGYAIAIKNRTPVEKIVSEPENVSKSVTLQSESDSLPKPSHKSIDKFIKKHSNEGDVKIQQQGASETEPRGKTTKIGTINHEIFCYDFDVNPTEVAGRLSTWVEAWKIDAEEDAYLVSLLGKQIPASYDNFDYGFGDTIKLKDKTSNFRSWLKQKWTKSDLGDPQIKDREPKGNVTGSVDTSLSISVGASGGDPGATAGLSVDIDTPYVERTEQSTVGRDVKQKYRYPHKYFNKDATKVPVSLYSLGYGHLSKDPADSKTLLKTEMKGEWLGPGDFNKTEKSEIDATIRKLDQPVQ
ncbi:MULTISPECIES: hypothetical protein [Haloarcula]|uniref:Uncharacterized protein n=2 Tax=Haloarcula TaxID=2237 RepID=A0A847U8P7_HALAR|nr:MULTISPECIES: hypothetical protein [Haloarcula]KAA9404582.1 hypothetical protein EGO51_18960 [Haloarcula hispanica]MUV51107.1 hypothetical protein [Haloarcula sp. CBA1122]NLV12143.1 hypothetical protein [Haloarcula argentinensis]